MVEKNREIILINRDSGHVGYTIPDSGIHREFTAGESKKVTFDEIEKLSWVPGGREMLKEYLIINDEEAAEEILGEIQPEYFYTKEHIQKLLEEGSIDQLEDALEFGPKGVQDLIKQEAVELKIDSSAKRDVIQNATHFNVTRSIELNKESEDGEGEVQAETQKRRRSQPIAATKSSSNYKVVTIKK